MEADQRGTVMLWIGVVVGLALALAGLLDAPARGTGLPAGAVALVGEQVIVEADLVRAIAAVNADRREPADAAERRRLLDRLIDEELLLQHAFELGLTRRDPRIRGQLVGGVIEVVVGEADASEPSAHEVEAFYDQHRGYFAQPGRVRVRRRRVLGDTDAARRAAQDVAQAWREGRPVPAGSDVGVPVPDDLLPLTKLTQYLGPTLVEHAASLEVGAVSEPIAQGGAWHVVQVVDRGEPHEPPLDEIRDVVAAELRRRRGEEALRRYVDDLRRRTVVVTRELP